MSHDVCATAPVLASHPRPQEIARIRRHPKRLRAEQPRGAWFKGLSHTQEGGTKIYGISGKVKRPGFWELPMGTTVGEILEEYAGGMSRGLTLRGILPGGASTSFLTEDHLDIRMDFGSMIKAGSGLGTVTSTPGGISCPGVCKRLTLPFMRRWRA